MISSEERKDLHRRLHGWFRRHGRDLPWRRTRDPYAILVSEFMLQQTTVAAVIPYFERWMAAFPDVAALAAAEDEQVLHLWQGLGYYSRARNLLRAAREVVSAHAGVIPDDVKSLRQLPGIGPYTAAAVAAFAFDQCVPVLDANIIRVVARLVDYQKPIASTSAKISLESFASELLPARGGRLHTSAIMELGALVCRSGQPDCPACPVREFCRAVKPENIPRKPTRQPTLFERDLRVIAQRSGNVYLVPSEGPRWRGLWVLPRATREGAPVFELAYVVTRHRIHLEVFRERPRAGWTAFSPDSLPPMPTPHRRALTKLLNFSLENAR